MSIPEFPLVVLFSIVIIILILRPFYKKSQENAHKAEERKKRLTQDLYKQVREILRTHKMQLAIQRRKSIFTDAYGKEDDSKWLDQEIPYFIDHHILPKLRGGTEEVFYREVFRIIKTIDASAKKTLIPRSTYTNNMDGFQFEVFCAAKLEVEGWKVSKTRSGADQGVDLIIEKGKRKIAVQCKKYGRPIGNKAVQEVKAGLEHYGLAEGVVLANSKFTKSAISLASSNNIKLLHYLETPQI